MYSNTCYYFKMQGAPLYIGVLTGIIGFLIGVVTLYVQILTVKIRILELRKSRDGEEEEVEG